MSCLWTLFSGGADTSSDAPPPPPSYRNEVHRPPPVLIDNARTRAEAVLVDDATVLRLDSELDAAVYPSWFNLEKKYY